VLLLELLLSDWAIALRSAVSVATMNALGAMRDSSPSDNRKYRSRRRALSRRNAWRCPQDTIRASADARLRVLGCRE
jgi:hypothetical protein